MTDSPTDKFVGCLLGTAVGDSMGLPLEGMSRRRGRKMARGRFRHSLVFGHGMISDDTDHICMTAQSLLASPRDSAGFARSLGWRLRGWLLTAPAGIGFGTLRSLIKLWIGFSPEKSGVFSAGNGPAMRAPILGLWSYQNESDRDQFVQACTRLTHSDPKAFEGAKVIADFVYHHSKDPEHDLSTFFEMLQASLEGQELKSHLRAVEQALKDDLSPEALADQFGLQKGITGYINHTVPIVLFCLLKFREDFKNGLKEIVALGGDADTTGAIYGGAAGAVYGVDVIPQEWRDGIFEWPRSVGWMTKLGETVARASEGKDEQPLALFWPGYFLRSPFSIVVIFTHVFRRMLPPY
ncbi:MAG: ADP-ribosylglycohydrolase family protein [Planctomycetota bacterium]|nr:ADP-ribosylglycohydrolase family protein [Planctomycetota bacterium]